MPTTAEGSIRNGYRMIGAKLMRDLGGLAFVLGFLLLGVPQASAAITYQTPGATAYSSANGSTVAPAYPASISKGDLLVLIIGMKPSSANSGSVTTPTNWTAITSLTGAGGYATTLGADTGNTNIFAYYRVADGTESGSLTVTISTNNVAWGKIFRMSNATGGWSVAGTTGSDTSAGSVSITMSADPGVTSGDYILGGMNIPTDVTTPAQFSAEALTQTGITFGTVTEVEEPDSTTGNDIGGFLIQAPVSSGTSSAAPVMTATAGGTTTNVRGPGIFIRAREVAATTIADGTNPGNTTIGPGGAITAVDVFTLTTSSGTDAITAVTVNLSTNSGVGTLTITDGSDVSLGSIGGGTGSGISTGSNTISISSTNATTGGTTFKIKVTPLSHANMPAVPGSSYSITATVTDWTGTNAKNPYLVTGDTSSTVTIDNTSPNAATSTSGSAGNAAVTLGWTTSSGETTDSVVLRWAASSPGAEVPVEGTSYSVGNTITTATVACVFTSQTTATVLSGKVDGSGGSSGCNTSALTNGQAYSYKVFQKDSNGNYDAGTTVSGGPFTPAASTISGTCKQVDRSTNCTDGQTVKWAINGTLQGTSTTTSSGTFSITPGTFPVTNDIITVFIDGVVDANEAVAVTKYDGTGSISGMLLYAQHLTIGSADNQTLTNANLGSYDNSVSADEDIFFDVTTNNLVMDATTSNSGQSLYVVSGNTYAPGGTDTVAGSWINAGTFTHGSSTVTLNGTTTGYIINPNGSSGPFYNLTINGSGGGWTLTSTAMTVANALAVTTGTLNGGASLNTTLQGSMTVGGTFNGGSGTSTVTFTNTGAQTIPATTFNNLTFSPAGTPTYAFSTGTTTVNGTLTIGDGTNAMIANANPASITLDVNGNFVLNTNATFQAPGSGKTFTIGGGFPTNDGTFVSNSGTLTFDATSTGNNIAYTSCGNAYYRMVFNGSGGGWNAGSGGAICLGDGGMTITQGTVTLLNNLYVASNNATLDGAGTLSYSGTPTITFNNGQFANSGNWTVYNVLYGDGGSASHTNSGSGTLTIDGTFTNTVSHTVNLGSKTYIFTSTGSSMLTNSGTLNFDTGSTVRFTGNGATTIPSFSYYNLQVYPGGASVTHTLPATLTVNGNLDLGGNSNAASTVITAATNNTAMTVKGNITLCASTCSNQMTYTKGTGTLTWSPVGTVTWTDNNPTTKQDLGTISITGGTSTPKINLGSSVSVSTITTVAASHELSLNGSNTLTLTGTTGTPLSVTGTFTASTGTVAYTGNNGAGNTTIANVTYNNLTLNNASETYVLAGATTLNGDLTITAGALDAVAGQNYGLSIGGSFTNNGTYSYQSNTTTFTATSLGKTIGGSTAPRFYNLTFNGSGGGWSNTASVIVDNNMTVTAGTVSGSSSTWYIVGGLTGNGTVTLSGTADMQIKGDGNPSFGGNTDWSFGNLTIGDGAVRTITASGSGGITVAGVLTISTGPTTLDAGSKTWTLSGTSGTPFVNNGNFTASTSTFAYTGNYASGNTTVTNVSYYNLTVNNGSETFAMPTTGTVTSNLTISAGTLLSSSGTLSIGGNFSNSGTFTHNSGTVSFTGAVTHDITGSSSTAFNNVSDTVSDSTLRFKHHTSNVPLYDVAGTFTITGTSGHKVTITSDDGANPWLVDFASAQSSVTYATISYSGCLTSATVTLDATSTDGGSNGTCWSFPVSSISIGGTATTTGTVAVAVNGSLQGQTTTISGGTWTISGVTPPSSGAIVTVWVDGATDANESTAVTKYDGTGNITGMVLNTNTLSLGSGDNPSFTLTSDFSGYDANTDEDVMFDYYSQFSPKVNFIRVVGGVNTYTDPTVSILSGATLTLNTSGQYFGGIITDNLTNAGTLTSVGDSVYTVRGNWTNSGIFTPDTSTATFTATDTGHTINNGASIFNNVTFDGVGGAWSPLTNELYLNGAFDIENGTFNNATGSANVTVAGGDVIGNGTINMTTGTFTVMGDSNLGFGGYGSGWTFYNLTFGDGVSLTGTTTTGSVPVTVANVLTIATNHSVANDALNFTLSGSGTPLVKTGTLANDSLTTFTYSSGSGVTALSSTAVTGGSAFGHLVINGTGTFTAGVALEAKQDLTISGGTLAMGTNNLTVGSTANANSGSIKVASGQSLTQSSAGTTTVLSSAAGANCIGSTGSSCSGTQGTITFGGLTIGDGATTFTTTLGATTPTVTVAGTLNLTASSTLNAGTGSNLTLSSSGTPITRSGTFTAGTGTVTYTSGSGITALSSAVMTGGNAFYNLTINGTGTFTTGVATTLGSDLTVTSGTLAGTSDMTVNGGDATGAGTVTLTGGTFLLDGTGSFGSAANWTFAGLTFGDGTGTSTTTSTGAGTVTTTGVLTIAANQTLDAASKTWTLSGTGTPFVKTGTFTPNASTFDFTGAGATTIPAGSYANLGIKPGANATTHTMGAGSFTISGNLTLGNGTNTTAVVDADTNDPGITTTGGSSVVAIANNTEFKAGGGQLILSGSGTPLTVGATAGIFTANNSDVKYEGTSATTIAGVTYYFLYVGTTANSSTVTYTLGGNTTALGLSVGASSGAGVHTLDASSRTLTLTGTGTVFSIGTQGGFTGSTSTVVYAPAPTSTVTLAPVTYHHLTLNSASTTFSLPSAGVTTDNGGDLTITAGTLDATASNYALSIGGNFANSGTFTPRSGTVTFTSTSTGKTIAPTSFYNVTFNGSGGGWSFNGTTAISGDLTMTAGTLSGTSDLTVSGNMTGNGTVTLTGGTTTMSSTTSQNFGGSTGWTFNNLTLSGASGTTTATGAGGITVNNLLTIGSNHTLDAGSKTWTLSLTGTPLTVNGTLTPSTSTFQYTGGHGTTFTPSTYYNLTLAPSCNGCAFVANNGTLTVGNDLVLGDGTHTSASVGLTGNNLPITVTRNLTISANTSFTAATASDISVGGNWSNSGTFNNSSRTVTFTATSGTKTIDNNSSSFYNLVLNGSGGTFQTSGHALSVSNDLTMTAGTLSGTQDVTVSGGDVTGDGTINITGGTFTVDGASGTGFGGGTGWTFNNLSFTGASSTTTATGAGGVTVSGTLTIGASHTFSAGSKTYTFSGTGTPISRSGTFTAGTSNATFTSGSGVSGIASAAMTGSNAFYDLTVNGTGTFTAGVALEAKDVLTVTSGTLAMAANNLTVGNSSNTNSGSIKVASGQSLTQSSGGTTTILTSASGSNCIGSNGSSCAGTQGTITFGGLTIGDGATTMTTTLGATTPTVTVAGVLNITASSTLNAGTGSTITLSSTGTPVTRSGTFTAGTSTLSFTSGSGTSGLFSAAMTGSNALYNLTINGTGTFTAGASALEVGNTLAVTSGTLDLNTNDPTLDENGSITIGASGTLSASNSASFTIAGDFTNAGAFTHNSGTVVFDTTGTSTISGATTFNNFTSTTAGKTIQFQKHTSNAPVFTFAGTFTITGTNGNNIILQSDTGSSQWLAHFNSAQSSVTYASIKDSGCDAGCATVTLGSTVSNLGNNGVCWSFPAFSVYGGGSTSASEGGSGGGTPVSGGGQGGGQGGSGGASSGGGTPSSGGGAGGGGGGASP